MKTKAFTIIELLVVITIIGIILAFALPNFNTRGKIFSTTYKNIADILQLARQTAITTNSSVVIKHNSNKIVVSTSPNDTFEIPSILTLNIISDGTNTDSILFYPSGATIESTYFIVSGTGKTDTIIVTVSGYILAR